MKDFKSWHNVSFTLLDVSTPHAAWQPGGTHPVTVEMYMSNINGLVNSAAAHAYKHQQQA